MSVLNKICARKAEHVEAQKGKTDLATLKAQIADTPTPKPFIKTLQNTPAPAIIAEVKKASPSKGIIREDFDPVEIAKTYEIHGAACLSVLTDEPYFQGQDNYLRKIRNAVTLPLLRKDFMIDPYQIYESRSLGADCILLIMAALNDATAQKLHNLAHDLKMDVLVEVHNKEELERALLLSPAMIGVNNRNLKTLEVDVATSHALQEYIPNHVLRVAESGISNKTTIDELTTTGYQAFLIGESLMRQSNIGNALSQLIEKH